jgi:hypothetical protein
MGGDITEADLVINAKFDVFRLKSKKYMPAVAPPPNRVKFHFCRLKKQKTEDEWMDVG